MQIIITGGGGFLGQKLARALLHSSLPFSELLLVDIQAPPALADPRVRCLQADLTAPGVAESLISERTTVVYHLAAIVSSHAEQDFDLGWQVNLDTTRSLLEACRHARPGIRFVFTSSLAVYGGPLPELVNDGTALTPTSSYGTQKAMGELLVNDYSRKGYVDGLALRLPTICVRPGKPNRAASSFVSSIIREPLQGEVTVCPVSPDLRLWLSSPATVVANFLLAATLPRGDARSINLPGISVTVGEMLTALTQAGGQAARDRVQFAADPAIERIVASWPGRIDNQRASALGFMADRTFADIIDSFITHDMQEAS
ncbi:D-erythronate dehydrogenase [Aeromonas hydrophila]|uniref:NAD-dependent epimerase/dehydratase:Short-chain dehydrogenase/reductase SDR:3-beta hydroxysteroid dehydrogenase/isomerase:dTDP-4-dehydrorhamnose reductase n=1 Tax=Aeromonas hydrophila subsp. hydrophila (strain ATCC 7966 / DSM 30187 / BCRC 13018 / CCUG 14551 / JCM 1027 / KCTC 2358 / NCIMB 9240 / NCTC 8049) TaxID=380703 RepID=A0KH49_AERHH|nr:D-erythronate dehydrogenase [Aeromonas hydrophila]ABK36119.1 NAD-dependent epimerase/dehydratase:Short-chain dehydrogenase/reductase SDR:3-beta hydroxysteroid dehydrogenase/isomerase:dTDP-4-dehydrorhamnose reductase [Aeromonas hydrophila subsp. hydrophila ATCC 7966]MBS4670265.1 SDR family oxidoreductase [Aeromonas hydrophila]MBW3811367.1 SDR family oxidoreductase [Aeromonas hydrophila]MCP3325268.1 SDR family oxidoreductase [Aeromonas hydrophila]MCR3953434.1 SDR family oxidoreductase [Aeromo